MSTGRQFHGLILVDDTGQVTGQGLKGMEDLQGGFYFLEGEFTYVGKRLRSEEAPDRTPVTAEDPRDE